MNRAWLKIPALAALAAAPLAAFVSSAACRRQQNAPEQSLLRVGVYSSQDYLPFSVIQEQELDRKHGIRLVMEKKTYSGGAGVIEAIAAGSVGMLREKIAVERIYDETLLEPFLSQSLLRGDGKLLGWIIGGPPFERMESTLIAFSAAPRSAE